MSRKRTLAIAAIALLAALALIRSATGSDPVFPATVAAILNSQADVGAENWHLDVTLRDGTAARIDYHGIRPNRTVGDPLCVIGRKSGLFTRTYQVSSQIDC